ncbi:MAG: hypothetical protein KDA90_18705 [Planctomycetaceae bacterium]|nr:hypothetical protein [Planctomycetaceae bacterium]
MSTLRQLQLGNSRQPVFLALFASGMLLVHGHFTKKCRLRIWCKACIGMKPMVAACD